MSSDPIDRILQKQLEFMNQISGVEDIELAPPPHASKNDKEKPDLSLLPKVFLEEVAKAFMVGERKYGRYNYCKGHTSAQLIAAALRHLTAYNEGEEYDPVDGQSHLGAAGANIAMLLRQQELGTLKDNRFKK